MKNFCFLCSRYMCVPEYSRFWKTPMEGQGFPPTVHQKSLKVFDFCFKNSGGGGGGKLLDKWQNRIRSLKSSRFFFFFHCKISVSWNCPLMIGRKNFTFRHLLCTDFSYKINKIPSPLFQTQDRTQNMVTGLYQLTINS